MAQLVARDIWDVDAAGSNPVTPTKNPADLIFNVKLAGLFICLGKQEKERYESLRTVPFVVYADACSLSLAFSAAISARFLAIISSSLTSHSS